MKRIKKSCGVVFALVLGLGLLAFGFHQFRESKQLKAEGKKTIGQVTNERTSYGRRGRIRYYLTVQYQDANKQGWTREFQVDREIHHAALQEGSVPVYFLPSDPKVAQAGPSVVIERWTMIFGGIVLFIGLCALPSLWRPGSREELADTVGEHFDRLCDPGVRYEQVQAGQFKHLDLAFYDLCQQQLEERGYVHLEDVEVIYGKPNPNFARTFVRLLLHRDGFNVASIFHLKPGWKLRLIGAKECRTYGVGTHFTDQALVGTDNAEAVAALDPVPGFEEVHLPSRTPLGAVIDSHEHRLKMRPSQSGVTAVRVQGTEHLHRLLVEQHQRKTAYRRQHGMSKQSLERLGGTTDDPVINNLHLDLKQRGEQRRRDVA